MKKILMIAAVLTAFSLQAGDAVMPQLGKAKAQQEQLTAKKKSSVKGWYKAIGTCNVRYGPGENYGVAYQIYDGEPVWVLGRVGSWYKISAGSGDSGVFYTHVQNLRRYRGPVTWG